MAICIPPANGVPWISEPPQWWDNTASKPRAYNTSLEDPRWDGAVRREYQYGTTTDAVFRAVQQTEGGKPYIYLLWHVLEDPSPDLATDGIFVGFQRPGGTAYVIEVDAYGSLAPGTPAQNPAGFTVYQRTGPGAWSSISPNPTWLTEATKAWLTVHPGPPQTYEWAIAMRVPVNNAGELNSAGMGAGGGINLSGASFKFFFAIVTDHGAQTGAYPVYWPRLENQPNIEITLNNATLQNVYPEPNFWDDATLGTGGVLGCGPGISLDRNDIGTTNTDPTTGLPAPTQIHASLVNPTTNHIYARPYNNTGVAVDAHAIRASFRTANWGSQVPWSGQFAAGATPWEEILDGTPDPAHRDNQAVIPQATKGEIAFDWTISTAQAADWVGPGASKQLHQCMLVTLSAPGQNIDFVNDSIYQNMDFVKTSTFERPLEISLKGLPQAKGRALPIGGTTDVFVYVSVRNMPKAAPTPIQPRDLTEIFHPEKPFTRARIMPLLGQPLLRQRNGEPPDSGGPIGSPPNVPPRKPPQLPPRPVPPPSTNELLASLPNVRYLPYYSTGKRIRIGGKVRPVIRSLTSFGYIVQQSRAVVGWDHALGGAFTKVGPNVYKLGVPAGGTKQVLTRVIGYEGRLPQNRLAEIVAGPPGPIQKSIPVLKNMPGIGSVLNRVVMTVLRRG
jgi:hypothetical protein